MARRLSDFPYVLVRLHCVQCPRVGQYRLARLAATWGAEISLEDLAAELTRDCRHRQGMLRDKHKARTTWDCGIRFTDVDSPLPPDVPPAMMALRVIRGGKD